MRKELQKHFKSILSKDFKYIPSYSTDIMKTWKLNGWKQPSQNGEVK